MIALELVTCKLVTVREMSDIDLNNIESAQCPKLI